MFRVETGMEGVTYKCLLLNDDLLFADDNLGPVLLVGAFRHDRFNKTKIYVYHDLYFFYVYGRKNLLMFYVHAS